MTAGQRATYLDQLRLDAEPPSLAALEALVTAHLARVPFENASKLAWAGRGLPPALPSLDEFLAGAVRDGTGGTCYLLNSALNALLRDLGYDAVLCGADMDRPDVHLVNVVRLDDRPYLVDVGYGAPLFRPLPLDEARPQHLARGSEAWVLHPADPDGRHRLEQLRHGERVHGYVLDLRPRRLEEFTGVVADSFGAEAVFMNRLRLIRHTPARSVSLLDLSVVITATTDAHT
ncbi:MAG: arylamine N-acetyltransferase, partial [Candidatus Krumholzibacteriia bacterium]